MFFMIRAKLYLLRYIIIKKMGVGQAMEKNMKTNMQEQQKFQK